jgi:SpoVK/Ycf46/Vps4 family AAA+-type ATPase
MSNLSRNSRPDSRDTPERGLESVVGFPSVAQRLRSIVVHPVTSAWAGTPEVVAPTGVLLYGPPGDAPDALGLAVGHELGVHPLAFDARTDVVPPIIGPAVIHLGSIDNLHRAAGGHGRAIGDLFGQIGRIPAIHRPLVIATSAAPWHLDPSHFTAGSLDRLVFVPPPSWEARTVALEAGAASRGLDVGQRITLLAAATVGWSGADLDELIEQLALESAEEPTSEIGRSSLLLDVVSRIVPRTRSWIGRAREMADARADDGMFDDLVAWLRRAE